MTKRAGRGSEGDGYIGILNSYIPEGSRYIEKRVTYMRWDWWSRPEAAGYGDRRDFYIENSAAYIPEPEKDGSGYSQAPKTCRTETICPRW